MLNETRDPVLKTRNSRSLEDYNQNNRTVAALSRCENQDIGRSPGQDVRYVVVDNHRQSHNRVRLPIEAEDYDPGFYVDLAIRATESVLSPLGWDEVRIRTYLRDTEDTLLERSDNINHHYSSTSGSVEMSLPPCFEQGMLYV